MSKMSSLLLSARIIPMPHLCIVVPMVLALAAPPAQAQEAAPAAAPGAQAQGQAPAPGATSAGQAPAPGGAAVAQGQAPAAAEVNAEAPRKGDDAAAVYLLRCAGCHTVGGGALRGADLKPSTQWPEDTLRTAIKRMEKNTGPIAAADVTQLVSLLKDPAVRARLDAEKARTALAMAAKLDPPSVAVGRALFLGTRPLEQGGMACAACHRVDGRGGALGPDLSGLAAKMDKVAMVSAFEQLNFKVMRAAYRMHPVSKQEAVHLVAFVTSASGAASEGGLEPAIIARGVGLALAAFALIAASVMSVSRGRGANARRRLIDAATRR